MVSHFAVDVYALGSSAHRQGRPAGIWSSHRCFRARLGSRYDEPGGLLVSGRRESTSLYTRDQSALLKASNLQLHRSPDTAPSSTPPSPTSSASRPAPISHTSQRRPIISLRTPPPP